MGYIAKSFLKYACGVVLAASMAFTPTLARGGTMITPTDIQADSSEDTSKQAGLEPITTVSTIRLDAFSDFAGEEGNIPGGYTQLGLAVSQLTAKSTANLTAKNAYFAFTIDIGPNHELLGKTPTALNLDVLVNFAGTGHQVITLTARPSNYKTLITAPVAWITGDDGMTTVTKFESKQYTLHLLVPDADATLNATTGIDANPAPKIITPITRFSAKYNEIPLASTKNQIVKADNFGDAITVSEYTDNAPSPTLAGYSYVLNSYSTFTAATGVNPIDATVVFTKTYEPNFTGGTTHTANSVKLYNTGTTPFAEYTYQTNTNIALEANEFVLLDGNGDKMTANAPLENGAKYPLLYTAKANSGAIAATTTALFIEDPTVALAHELILAPVEQQTDIKPQASLDSVIVKHGILITASPSPYNFLKKAGYKATAPSTEALNDKTLVFRQAFTTPNAANLSGIPTAALIGKRLGTGVTARLQLTAHKSAEISGKAFTLVHAFPAAGLTDGQFVVVNTTLAPTVALKAEDTFAAAQTYAVYYAVKDATTASDFDTNSARGEIDNAAQLTYIATNISTSGEISLPDDDISLFSGDHEFGAVDPAVKAITFVANSTVGGVAPTNYIMPEAAFAKATSFNTSGSTRYALQAFKVKVDGGGAGDIVVFDMPINFVEAGDEAVALQNSSLYLDKYHEKERILDFKLRDTKPTEDQPLKDGDFWVLKADAAGDIVKLEDTLTAGPYIIRYAIEDNGDAGYDLDDTVGTIQDPAGASSGAKSGRHSSSGCTVGTGSAYDLALLLLALMGMVAFRAVVARKNS